MRSWTTAWVMVVFGACEGTGLKQIAVQFPEKEDHGDGGGDDADADADADADGGAPPIDTQGTTIDTQGTPIDTSSPTPDGDDPEVVDDTDGDGILDEHEGRYVVGGPVDTDGDGYPDYIDGDSDGDGIADEVEGVPTTPEGYPPDTDGDGIPDFRDTDSDGDGLPDARETTIDLDGDGIPEWRDPRSDAPTPAIGLVVITTDFNSPVGIDFHETSETVIMSVHYSSGDPYNFERVLEDGSHLQFSTFSHMTDEVKIATVRSGNVGGFTAGRLFVGNGTDGQIVRISADGSTIDNPWVDLPGDSNGLMRGSLYIDRTDVFGGDLIAVTTNGQVWRITSAGSPTLLAELGAVHLEGTITVPDSEERYGPLAGKILAGAEGEGRLYAISPDGTVEYHELGVNPEDIDIIMPDENWFGVNYGSSQLMGVPAYQFAAIAGDIMLTQEGLESGTSGLYRLHWTGSELVAELFPLAAGSAIPAHWEHVTFADAGIREVPDL